MWNTRGYPGTSKLPVAFSAAAAAAVCAFFATPASAADCRFLQRTIPELRAQCTAGSFCPDLEAFKSQAKQTCGQSYDPDEASAGAEAPAPMAEAEQPPQRDREPPPLDRCTDIPTDRAYFEAQLAGVVSARTQFLREGLDDLRRIKAGLEKEYQAVVGDPHSAREISTYLKQVVKTTAALIDGLAGFAPTTAGAQVTVDAVEKWTAIVYTRYKAADKLLQSPDEILFEFSTDALAKMHPALRAAKVTYTFSKNMNTLRNLSKDMNNARSEYALQIEALEQKIHDATLQIARSELETRARRVEMLVKIFKTVKQQCVEEQRRGQ